MVVPIAPSMMAMRLWRSSWSGCMGELSGVSYQLSGSSCQSSVVSCESGGLASNGQDHLQMGFSGLSARYLGGADGEARGGEQVTDFGGGEAGVAFAVGGSDLVLAVLVQAQHDEPTVGAQDARTFGQRPARIFGVSERVEHQNGVERAARKRQLVHVRDLRAHVLQLVKSLACRFDHARAGVDAGQAATVRGQRTSR